MMMMMMMMRFLFVASGVQTAQAQDYKGYEYSGTYHTEGEYGGAANYRTGGTPAYPNETHARGSTNRTGNLSEDALTAPSAITGVPYKNGLYDAATDGSPTYTTGRGDAADTTATSGDQTAGAACGAQGFMCDFKDYATMGAYDAFDFVWKIVDPLDYGKHKYKQRTLNCVVQISKGTLHQEGQMPHSNRRSLQQPNDYFYVPIGQENQGTPGDGSDPYCDVEAVRRQVNDADLNMTDMIRIRGETARLNDNDNSTRDLVGEQFDLICKCTAALSTEAKTGFQNAANALLTVMDANGKERTMEVTLSLYSDSLLQNEIAYPAVFPSGSQHFYFLVKHGDREDWNFQLQISSCVVCDIGTASCSTKQASDSAVFIWERCRAILGGPQETAVNPNSWYHDSGVYHVSKFGDSTTHRWSEGTPGVCPYHAIGLQKFRISNAENIMKMTCLVTACTARPCVPCSTPPAGSESVVTRRLMGGGRRLQLSGGGDVEVSQNVRLLPSDQPRSPRGAGGSEAASGARSRRVSIFAFVLLLLLALVSAATARALLLKKRRREERKSVAPVLEEGTLKP